MGQRDSFAGGFLAGAIVGSLVGGLVGATLASRRKSLLEEGQSLLGSKQGGKFESEDSIEIARRRLEDKIAQLNLAIDDVRQQLDPIDGNPPEYELSNPQELERSD